MVFFVAVALFFNLAASQSTAKYTNHTVGGPAGWFYNINTKKTSADYSAWAAKQTFNLGDYLSKFLIFFSTLFGRCRFLFDGFSRICMKQWGDEMDGNLNI